MLQEIVAGALPSGAAVAADDHRVDDVKVMITMNIIMTLIMAMVLVMVVLRCASVGSAIFSLISGSNAGDSLRPRPTTRWLM
jgi:hypothetical protein